MTELGSLVYRISGDSSALRAELAKTNTYVSQSTDGVSKLAGMLKTAFTVGGIIAAGKAIFSFTAGVVKGSGEAQANLAQLNQTLESTNHAAGMTSEELQNLAQSLSETTRFEDDAIIKSEALLLTFTRIGRDVFPDAQRAILDVAAAMGGGPESLQGATIQVGKALNNPIQGISALTRVGIQFTEQQKEQIKVMMQAGDVAGAQSVILKELQTQFGGQAAAQFKDNPLFAFEKFGQQIDNIKEKIGDDAAPALLELANALSIATKEGGLFSAIGDAVARSLAGVARMAAPLIKQINSILLTRRMSKAESAFEDAKDAAYDNYGKYIRESMKAGLSEDEAIRARVNTELKNQYFKTKNEYEKLLDEWQRNEKIGYYAFKTDAPASSGGERVAAQSGRQTGGYSMQDIQPERSGGKSGLSAAEKERQLQQEIAGQKEEERDKERMAREEEIQRLKAETHRQDILGIIATIAMWDQLNEAERAQAIRDSIAGGINEMMNLLGAVQQYQAAVAEQRISDIDRQMQAELAAAGLTEETEIEKLQAEYEEAKAKGDMKLSEEKQRELQKAEIEEKYRKKKAKAEYEAALQSWEIQRALAIAQGAISVINAYSSAAAIPVIGWIMAPIAAATAGIAAALQIAAVEKSKPQPSQFAKGGYVVPGSVYQGDQIDAKLNSGEMVLNQGQQRELFDIANGKGGSGSQPIHVTVMLGAKTLYDELFDAGLRREFIIPSTAVVPA